MIVNPHNLVAAYVDPLLGFAMQRTQLQKAILGALLAGNNALSYAFLDLAH